jgi:hypothetical protein
MEIQMLEQLRHRLSDRIAQRFSGKEPSTGLASLRMLAAELLVVTGVGATLDVLSRAREAQRDRIPGASLGGEPLPLAAVWGPALISPLAAAAHVRHATRPSERSERATRFLDSAVVGLGLVELAGSLTGLQRRRRPVSLVPLALASAGLLGLAVGQREREIEREQHRLQRRARVVERLVPRRRPKFEKIVLHV